ncbi:7624_t:CDS:2, partial [Acaulospora colombiana]
MALNGEMKIKTLMSGSPPLTSTVPNLKLSSFLLTPNPFQNRVNGAIESASLDPIIDGDLAQELGVETVVHLNPSNAEGREESRRECNNGEMDHYRVISVNDRVEKIESAARRHPSRIVMPGLPNRRGNGRPREISEKSQDREKDLEHSTVAAQRDESMQLEVAHTYESRCVALHVYTNLACSTETASFLLYNTEDSPIVEVPFPVLHRIDSERVRRGECGHRRKREASESDRLVNYVDICPYRFTRPALRENNKDAIRLR